MVGSKVVQLDSHNSDSTCRRMLHDAVVVVVVVYRRMGVDDQEEDSTKAG
jgi:hypothetical protein